ncbi:MAG: polyprenyl synthetase family protein [Chloroflexi bacterium]|nr:polyprenyl synthetase family protein [Chloroflexota bacterium]
MSLPDSFSRYQDELEAELRAVVDAGRSPLYNIMRYHLGWIDEKGQNRRGAGKMARPTLCLLACEVVGGDWRSALPAAAAVELIHNFSLIHDDIQDRSRERRNRVAVWKLWGEAQGINAGDAMYALAQLALLRLERKSTPLEKIILLSRGLAQASVELCEGQYLDVAYEGRLDTDTEHYLDMIDKKTARLFETSLCFGAILGTDNQAQISALGSFGRNLGMAFQVHNDLQGICGGKGAGRSFYTDIRNRKKTLPIIYALQRVDAGEKERLVELYGRPRIPAKDVPFVMGLLSSTGARGYAEKIKEQYHLQALKDLARAVIPPSFQQQLREVAAFLLQEDQLIETISHEGMRKPSGLAKRG